MGFLGNTLLLLEASSSVGREFVEAVRRSELTDFLNFCSLSSEGETCFVLGLDFIEASEEMEELRLTRFIASPRLTPSSLPLLSEGEFDFRFGLKFPDRELLDRFLLNLLIRSSDVFLARDASD